MASICERLRALREEVFGARGRATFARAINLSPSTYIYYEKGRVPPSDVLARAGEVTGARVEWLLTGEGPRFKVAPQADRAAEGGAAPLGGEAGASNAERALVERFRQAVASKPRGEAAVGALAAILDEVNRAFPEDKPAQAWQRRHLDSADGLIPILGRSAAGLLASWDECFGPGAEGAGPALADLAERLAVADVHSRPAKDLDGEDLAPAGGAKALDSGGVRLVQLSEPLESGVVEFVECASIRAAQPRAFAVRVDGESMSPRFRQGDILIVSPDAALRQGQAAVVQVKGKIGATVKLFRRDGEVVHLIPINERYEPMRIAADRIEWALPVLYCVRV